MEIKEENKEDDSSKADHDQHLINDIQSFLATEVNKIEWFWLELNYNLQTHLTINESMCINSSGMSL